MKKYPVEQMDLDFDGSLALGDSSAQVLKPSPLTLVSSRSTVDYKNSDAADRERIISNIVSYAQRLSW
jgi:hypothetical protein